MGAVDSYEANIIVDMIRPYKLMASSFSDLHDPGSLLLFLIATTSMASRSQTHTYGVSVTGIKNFVSGNKQIVITSG
tara:strand:- start:212 stop:442 length:231 start_codon:yes stop_codon:yes gene_type:complete